MKIPLPVLAFLCVVSLGWAQPFGLTNRVANTTLRLPLAPTPTFNYRIPPDNPFVGATNFNGVAINSNNVRTEFWAVGLRNPWRWSFDRETGLLYLGDVGQGLWEEINIIQKGSNYGWAYREGAHNGPKAAPSGFTSIDPIFEYGGVGGVARSVTGGVVYRGSRMPELQGYYIFADYETGQIRKLLYDTNSGTAMDVAQIATEQRIASLGIDPSNGDVLLGHVVNGRIRRLMPVSGGGYALSNAFGDTLTFAAPVKIVTPPGETNRIFIVEQTGRIAVITNLASPNRTVFMTITNRVRFNGEQGLLGLAFHPGYLTNRYFYVTYVGNTNGNQGADSNTARHGHISRFEISPTDPNVGLPDSELVLIRQADEAANHNGGDIDFGADGYLYVSLGDEGLANDSLNNSQTITKDFYSAIIRIDVDNRPDSLMPNAHPANTIGAPVIIPPPTLADTGIFSDLLSLTPNAGIIPYDVNTPYWTDGAIKSRWFSIPDLLSRITFRSTQSWTFQTGAVWVQHFELETTNGVPESRRRIETRVLVRDTSPVGHYGVTYRWDSPTNAALVPPEGAEEIFTVTENGTPREQTWRYPRRADCLVCHHLQAGRALGFNTPQLNRDFNYAGHTGVIDNQLRALGNAGYFSLPLTNLHGLPLMARLDDTSFGVQHRARSYLMANCSHCHYPGTTNGNFNAQIYRVLSVQGIIDGSLRNTLGDPLNRAISRASLDNSMIHTRMSSSDASRMPPLDSLLPDQQALNVFRDWILELANYSTFAEWQVKYFGSSNDPNATVSADPDGDGARNQLEYFTGTNPTNALDAWSIGIQRGTAQVSVVYTQKPNYGFEVQWTTNNLNPASWRLLNLPANRPSFPGQERIRSVPDDIEPVPMKNYRVRVFEP